MTNRQRGDYLERQARAALESCGWYVARSAGSLGPADLVALRAGFRPLLVACKTNGRIGPGERAAIVDAATLAGARPMLAARALRGHVDLFDVRSGCVSPLVDRIKVPKR
jgi:Holliday junction resolvase